MQEFEKYEALAGHIERMARTGKVGNSYQWFNFLSELETVLLVLWSEKDAAVQELFDGTNDALDALSIKG
tara:strand:+ start:12788 stop:12997 length:210 start_codon:yes stop_codon:yes gene_type:complete